MTIKFKEFVNKMTAIPDEELDKIINCFTYQKVERNTVLLSQGEVCTKFYILISGCSRTYYITQEGQEKTRMVSFSATPITSLTSFITQKPSVEFIDVLEDSEFLFISQSDFFRFVNEIPAWAKFYQKNLELAFAFQNSRIEDLVTLSAKERYEKLLKEHPHYIQRLSNRIVATYLGISQETLSRLKSK